MSPARRDKSALAKGLALALGFDRAGFARAERPAHAEHFRRFIEAGYAGEMTYLARRSEERLDPTLLLPGTRTILCVALRYAERGPELGGAPETDRPTHARVARYASGRDYHEVMEKRLRRLGEALELLVGEPFRWRAYVDTGPVLEREFAAAAGLGWIGKNTCLIDTSLGSYLFLGVLLCEFEFDIDEPMSDHCGSCRACLDACPTDALREARVLDATRCLAYSTIELRSATPDPLREPQENWVFGCDICQEVCPWNLRRGGPPEPIAPLATAFERDEAWRAPALEWVLGLDETAWRRATRKSALRRSTYRGLLRNALVAAGNSGDAALLPLVERHVASADALIAEHAAWARDRIGASS